MRKKRTRNPQVEVPNEIKICVREEIDRCLEILREQYYEVYDLPYITVEYLKRGKVAGMAQAWTNIENDCVGEAHISLNSALLVQNTNDFIDRTVRHEVCHIIEYAVQGRMKAQHDGLWITLMKLCGTSNPTRFHSYDTSNCGVKKFQKKFVYTCGCREHHVTATKHNKMVNGQIRICATCRRTVIFNYKKN